jgi:hypothetical protein
MYPPVDTKDPAAVQAAVQASYLAMFPLGDRAVVSRSFEWVVQCFTGHYGDYQAVDTRYHDLEHTLQGTLCMVRLLEGRHRAQAKPAFRQRLVELSLLAILLHDTGYLKERADTEGTGAKYTAIHVRRSADFAATLLQGKGFSPSEILSVQNMILCTGVNASLAEIPFQSESERLAGFALATADLLGQMAADDYIDKLPVLYAEFAEAAHFMPDKSQFVAGFASAADLIRRTPSFWRDHILARLDREFLGQYRYLSDPYPDGPNPYLDRIEGNMIRLQDPSLESAMAGSR